MAFEASVLLLKVWKTWLNLIISRSIDGKGDEADSGL
jgi:hypothetical protein